MVIVAILAAACATFGAAATAAAAAPARYFGVPAAAYTNQLGNFPAVADCASTLPEVNTQPIPVAPVVLKDNPSQCPAGDTGTNDFQYNQPAAQPGLGVPLGGVGAGSFMINQAGSFGPWDFGGADENAAGPPTQYEDRILPQAAFHVREQLGDGSPSVTTLAVNAAPWNQLPSAWHTLKVGQGEYGALWPFGWASYKPFAAGVSMRFWSPIVAGDDELTSMPVAFFDVRLANTTDQTDHLSVMFTMPNASDHASGTVRTGLSSNEQTDPKSGVSGVTLSSSSPKDTPDAANSDWTIAADPASGQHVSYVTSWNANGNGSDIYDAFSTTGNLPDRSLDTSASAGAIAVSVTLKPGQVTTIPFVLAWDFPQTSTPGANACSSLAPCESWTDNPSQYWMRRYTSYFGARETATNDYVPGSYAAHQGFIIANRMLAEHDRALGLVEGWYDRIVDNSAYPSWVVRETLNEEIQMVFNDSFWEAGRITSTPSTTSTVGSAVPGEDLFCTSTGGDWDTCNEWDTDAWGYLTEMLLWPGVERGRLLGVLQETREGINGVNETGDTQYELSPLEPLVGRMQFADVPMATIFRSYAYYRRTGDTTFLRYAYPAMLELTESLLKAIHAPDHIPLDLPAESDSYDAWVGLVHNAYNAQLWLLTDEVMIDATEKARALGVAGATQALEQELQANLAEAKPEFQSLFWDAVTGHYKFDPSGAYGDGYFIDSFFAQQIASTLGLPPLVPMSDEVKDLLHAYPQQMQEKVDGHLVGPPNIVPAAGPPYADMIPIEQEEVWPGSAWAYASVFIQAGRATHNRRLTSEGLTIAHSLEYWDTEHVSSGFLFEVPDSWQWDAPSIYRSPSFNQSRDAIDVLNAIDPIVKWAVPSPQASEFTASKSSSLPVTLPSGIAGGTTTAGR